MENMPQLFSQETERALLGCILIDSECLIELDVTPDDFYVVKHRWVFEAASALARRHEAVDFLTISQELEKRKQIEEVGGMAFVMSLINSTPSSLSAKTYAKLLRDKARRRNLVKVAGEIAKAAYDETSSIDESIPAFVNGLVSTSAVNKGAQPLALAMSELYDEVQERIAHPADIWGIPTRLPTFDKTTGGLQRGELFLLAGTPGVGKSILGMDMAAGMALSAPGAIYSMEMRRKQVARRLVSGQAFIPTHRLKSGRFEDGENDRFTKAIDYFSTLPVHIADSSGWTTTSLRADLARLKALYGIEWFLLDYLFLLNDGGKDEVERTQNASKGLKQTVMELDLAGIAIHSLNKAGMGATRNGGLGGDGLPNGLDDMRGSGQVAYDADLACFLTKYNPEVFAQADRIPAKYNDIARVLWFGKGRELENPRQYVTLVQKQGFPKFGEYIPEQNQGGRP
jgi:replicative DNA helicase